MALKILTFLGIARKVPEDNDFTFYGGEKRSFEVLKRWSEAGNDIHIVSSDYAKALSDIFNIKVTHHIYHPSFLRGGVADLINIKRMLAEIPDDDFDLIYCSGEPFLLVTTSAIAKKRLKIPMVTSINLFGEYELTLSSSFKWELQRPHHTFIRNFGRGLLITLKRAIRNSLLKKSDTIFSVSKYTKNLLHKIGIKNNIYSVSGGIDFNLIQSIEPQKKIYDASFMGALHRRKGVFDLIEAWKGVAEKKADSKLIILGDGIEKQKLTELIQKYQLEDNITLAGYVGGYKKYRILKSSKIFIFPSYLDSFGQAVCEALACGLPAITYDIPVFHEWHDEIINYVEVGNISGLVKDILSLLNDPESRESLGELGKKSSKRYTWDQVAKYELEIMEQLIK